MKIVNLRHFVSYIKRFMFVRVSYTFLHSNSICPKCSVPALRGTGGWVMGGLGDDIGFMFTSFSIWQDDITSSTKAALPRRGGIQEKRKRNQYWNYGTRHFL